MIFKNRTLLGLFLAVFTSYILVSFIVTGAFGGKFHSNHFLYLVNLGAALLLSFRVSNPFVLNTATNQVIGKKHFLYLLIVLIFIVLLAFVLINMHGELNGSKNRFE